MDQRFVGGDAAAPSASEPQIPNVVPRSSSPSSSSSSSSQSSSSSSSSSNRGPEQNVSVVAETRSGGPTRGMSHEIVEPPRERVIQEQTHDWGPFRMTWRGGSTPGWQATCRWHADFEGNRVKTRCTRSIAVEQAGSLQGQKALALLKAWCLKAPLHADKQAHQSDRPQEMSEQALEQGLQRLACPPEQPSGRAIGAEARKRKRTQS